MNPAKKVVSIHEHQLADENLGTLTEVAAVLAQHGLRPILVVAEKVGCPHNLELHNIAELDDVELESIMKDLAGITDTEHWRSC